MIFRPNWESNQPSRQASKRNRRLTTSLKGANTIGVKLMATNTTVKLNSNTSRDTPKWAGPQVAMIATEVQLIAPQVVMKTATKAIMYLCFVVQLKGFYTKKSTHQSRNK